MSDEGIQCDWLETDVTEELPNVNFAKRDTCENAVKSGVDLVCDNQDVDDVLDNACDFDIIEEEPGYNRTMLEDENYQPDTDQDTDTGTETETDGEESSSTKRPRSKNNKSTSQL